MKLKHCQHWQTDSLQSNDTLDNIHMQLHYTTWSRSTKVILLQERYLDNMMHQVCGDLDNAGQYRAEYHRWHMNNSTYPEIPIVGMTLLLNGLQHLKACDKKLYQAPAEEDNWEQHVAYYYASETKFLVAGIWKEPQLVILRESKLGIQKMKKKLSLPDSYS